MFTEDLYSKVLIAPVKSDANELFVVSGCASATFVNRHLKDLRGDSTDIIVHLIIGMKSNRQEDIPFKRLIKEYPDNFFGHYYKGLGKVHSNVYYWEKNGQFFDAYTGSANYSSSRKS